MPNFTYKAIDSGKQIVTGTISGKNKVEVAQLLSRKNLSPLTVRLIPERIRVKGSVPEIDKITFCRYLSTMLLSGLSLSEGIDVLKDETKNPLMRQILGDINYSLEQGQQLSTVFDRYPNVFPRYFVTLTRAGEVSGKLAEVFKYLESELRSEYGLNSKVKGALLYPGVVFSAMIGIGFLMFFFVLPQIGKVFLNLKLPLPAFTKALFTLSLILSKEMIPIIVAGIVAIILLVFALRKRVFRNMLFKLIQPLPIIKNLIKRVDMARFTRIFSTLLKSAVPITEALEISLSSLTWFEFQNLALVMPEEIRQGKPLASVIKEHKVFPTLIVQMVAAGEKTGTLETTLADLASFYEEEVQEELKNLTQVLEPVLMLLVGISVGIMILSIIAPIYSVIGSFQQAAGSTSGGPKL